MFRHRMARTQVVSASVAAASAFVLLLAGCAQTETGSAQMAQGSLAQSESDDAGSNAADSALTQDSAATTTDSSSTDQTSPAAADGLGGDAGESAPNAPTDVDTVIPDESSDTDSLPSSDAPVRPTAGSAGNCLVGDWMISRQELQSYYDTIDVPVDFTLNGNTGLTFTADTYEFTPDFTLSMNIQGTSGKGSINGSVTGSYTVDGSVVTTSQEDSDVSVSVTVGGKTIDGGDTFGALTDAFSINSAPYQCGAFGPVLMFETAGSERVPVHLVPKD